MKDKMNKVHHIDCLEFMKQVPDNYFDLVLTDPPYSAQTHLNAMTMKDGKPVNAEIEDAFKSISEEQLHEIFVELGRICKGWVIAFTDWKHTAELERNTPKNLKFVRAGVWVKPSYMPQITGDRPAQSWESIAFMHNNGKGKMVWNGGGTGSHFIVNKEKDTDHPTEKPIKLVQHIIDLFKTEECKVFDPFMGSGTTAVVCKSLGLHWCGCELELDYIEIINKRLSKVQKSLF